MPPTNHSLSLCTVRNQITAHTGAGSTVHELCTAAELAVKRTARQINIYSRVQPTQFLKTTDFGPHARRPQFIAQEAVR